MISQRLKQIIDNEGLSIRKFEEKISCTQGIITKCIRANTDISSKVISSIIRNFPQYSARWLLTGEGEMLLAESVNKSVNTNEKCKQTDMEEKMECEKERFYRRLEEMEKREEARDFLLNRIATTLEGINKILARLPQNPENENDVKNNSSMCG